MVDDVAIDERVRWLANQSCLGGICQHAEHLSLDITTYADLKAIHDALCSDEPTIHMGKEATVAALGPIRSERYAAMPICGQATCKCDASVNETSNRIKLIFNTIIRIWHTEDPNLGGSTAANTLGEISSATTDGAAAFRFGADKEFGTTTFTDEVPDIGAVTTKMLGFDQVCGRWGVVDGSDPKHIAKTVRASFKGNRGLTVANHTFDGTDTRAYLQELGEDKLRVGEVLSPRMEDAQNVADVVEFLRMMSRHKSSEVNHLKNPMPMSKSKLTEFNILAEVANCFLFLLTGKEGSIREHLENLSYLSHILFTVYRRQGTDFIPAQTYQNTQTMIKSMFKSVIQCQVLGITTWLIFFDSDDRLEVLFGVLRTMIGSQSGFDMAMLADKITSAYQVTEIFARRPHWKKGSRRLSGNITDHVSPANWTGNADVTGVSAPNCWAAGAAKARAFLSQTGLFDSSLLDWAYVFKTDSRITMQRPRGFRCGCNSSKEQDTAASIFSEQAATCTDGVKPIPRATEDELALVGQEFYDEASKRKYVVKAVDFSAHDDEIVVIREPTDGEHKAPGDNQVFKLRYVQGRIGKGAPNAAPVPELQEQAAEADGTDGADAEADTLMDLTIGDDLRLSEAGTGAVYIYDYPGFEGKPMRIDHAVKLMFSCNVKSADRLRRVMGFAKKSSQHADATAEALEHAQGRSTGLFLDSLVATLASVGGAVTMVLLCVESIETSKGHRAISISAEELAEAKSVVSGRILVTSGTAGGALVWQSGALSSVSVDVSGPAVKPVDPAMSPSESERFTMAIADLDAVFALLQMEQDQRTSKLPVVSCVGRLPYKNSNGRSLFVADLRPSPSAAPPSKKSKQPAKAKVKCGLCSASVSKDMLKDHMGNHILKGEPAQVEPCGFCGVKDSGVCNSRVEGKMVKTDCSLMDGQPCTSAKWASNVSKGHPCANVPVKCTGANCARFVWSYNLASHWQKNHSGATMPSALSNKSKVPPRERKWVAHVAANNRIPKSWK